MSAPATAKKPSTPSLHRKRSNLITARNRDNTKEKVLKHLKEVLGVVTYACERAGISTRTFYRWVEADTEFAEEVAAIQDMQLDFVEKNMLEAIKDKNPACLIFYLKTKGKHRGWVERLEHTGFNGSAIRYEGTMTMKERRQHMPDDSLELAVTSLLERNPAMRQRLMEKV